MYVYKAQASEELTIDKDVIIPVTFTHVDGWWEGVLIDDRGRKRKGLFPSNFVRVLP